MMEKEIPEVSEEKLETLAMLSLHFEKVEPITEEQFWIDAAELLKVRVDLRDLFANTLAARYQASRWVGKPITQALPNQVQAEMLEIGRKLVELGYVPTPMTAKAELEKAYDAQPASVEAPFPNSDIKG